MCARFDSSWKTITDSRNLVARAHARRQRGRRTADTLQLPSGLIIRNPRTALAIAQWITASSEDHLATCCNKCQMLVARRDDSLRYSIEVEKTQKYGIGYDESVVEKWVYTALLRHQSRHLFPVVIGGVKLCEGSPSRAQYLEGQPRDSRDFLYDAEQVPVYRAAFERFRAEIDTKSLKSTT